MKRSSGPTTPAARRKVVVKESTGSRVIEQSRVRLLCVGLFFLLCFLSINVRLIEMMIASHQSPHSFSKKALTEGQEPEDLEVSPAEARLKRGDIVDRNGVLLATSLMTASAFANPREISEPEAAAARLEKAVGVPREVLLKRLKSNKTFVWIKRHLAPAEQQAVNTLGIPGLYFQPEEQRVYPYGSLFSHVVGYVGVDNKGLAGVESTLDRRLTDEEVSRTPLALSVDYRIQHILRDEMQRAVEDFHALGATGIVLDARSSEILAMSSLPDFDPHKPARAVDAQKFNRAALGLYEMGSTFKSFTLALGMESGTATYKTVYDATNPMKFGTFTISDTHSKKRPLSVPEIYAYSSNVGTARLLLDIGTKKQRAFLEQMGMLKPIEIELPERAQPQYPKDWKDINGITIAYGHGISVTPLHLARGIATLVGGGKLMPLTLLKNGNEGKAEGEQVVSEDTSRLMARMMRLVVKHGTGNKADIPGYRVGGKTGTAEKVQAGGTYNKDNKMASFVATFPVDNPAYVILVMVDEPKGNKASYGYATGGWVAAPVVGRIIARMGPLMGIKPEFEVKQDDAEKYWVDTEKKAYAPSLAAKPPVAARYVHKAAY